MNAGKRRGKLSRRLVKGGLLAALLLIGEILMFVGGYYCIMTHLPDAIGIPLLIIGFFTLAGFASVVQDEYDRMVSAKYRVRPIYRINKRRRKKEDEHSYLRRHGRSAGKMELRRVS